MASATNSAKITAVVIYFGVYPCTSMCWRGTVKVVLLHACDKTCLIKLKNINALCITAQQQATVQLEPKTERDEHLRDVHIYRTK